MTELIHDLTQTFELGGVGYYIAMGLVFLGVTFRVQLYKAIGAWRPWPHAWYVKTVMAVFIVLFAFTPWVNLLTLFIGVIHWATTWMDVAAQRRMMRELDALHAAHGHPLGHSPFQGPPQDPPQ